MDATAGVTNKNAADTLGDFAFIFGSRGVPTPRGVKQYWNGIIEVNHVSVSSWGSYLQCNHKKGSTKYKCRCPILKFWTCHMKKAGKESNSHTNGHTWCSFPHAGQHKYWDYETGKGCENIEVRSSCVIKKLAKKAACPNSCTGPSSASKCVKCVNKLSDQVKESVW